MNYGQIIQYKGDKMVKNNTSEIGFEKQIWAAADKLRGSMDASEYKYVVLGLIFLKYISDKFEEKYIELKKMVKILKSKIITLLKIYFMYQRKHVGILLLKMRMNLIMVK